jgi:cytochrome b involved in lipid metabolism
MSYVLDLTAFLHHHPAGARKIMQKKEQLGADITRNFLDHFGHTVQTFRQACAQYDEQQTPVILRFRETPKPGVQVVIVGKIQT